MFAIYLSYVPHFRFAVIPAIKKEDGIVHSKDK